MSSDADSGRFSVDVGPILKPVLYYKPKDVKLRNNNGGQDGGYSSGIAEILQGYLNKPAGRRDPPIMTLFVSQIDNKISFYVGLNERFMKDLIEMLPFPYVQVFGDVRPDEESTTSNGTTIIPGPFDKRFELQEYLDLWAKSTKETGSPEFWQYLSCLVGDSPTDAKGNRKVSVKCEILVGWTEPIRLSKDLFIQNIYNCNASKDLTIVAGDGVEIQCHRIIFAAHSNVLGAMLSSDHGMKEFQTGRIQMENTGAAIEGLLWYLYGLELTTRAEGFPCEVAVELFQIADKYELLPLRDGLAGFLGQKNVEYFAPDVLLELYFYVEKLPGFKCLLDHALCLMTSIDAEIRACERFQDLNRKDALDLVWKLYDIVK